MKKPKRGPFLMVSDWLREEAEVERSVFDKSSPSYRTEEAEIIDAARVKLNDVEIPTRIE